MLGLVNDLIDLYLIKNGKFQQKLVPVSLPISINDLFNIVSLQAMEKSITIDINIDEPVGQAVLMFDDLRIRSIVLNLVNNAIKFSREGGKIDIKATFVDET
jgi:signal transduction histidine kinase